MARVTLVVNSFDEGSETFLHALAGQLDTLGHDVTVHALLDGRTTMSTGASFETGGVRRSAALPPARSRSFVPALGRSVARHPSTVLEVGRRAVARFGRGGRAARAAALAAPIVSTDPDVVHLAFSGLGVALVDAIELLEPATMVVVSCRGTGELISPVLDESVRPGLRRVLERADRVHAVAEVVAEAAVSWGADPGRVRVIRPAVDTARFRRSAPLPQRSGPLRVVTVARLHWIKAIDVQLAALAALGERGRDVVWQIVGDGPDRQALEFRARVLGVADRVSFLGSRRPEQVREVLESADLFVLSSLSEGTSNSVLEAMALEIPVISSGAGGMPEVLTDREDAMLVRTGDPGSLADAVEQIIDLPELAAELGAAGRRTVSGGYTLDRQRSEWGELYSAVLAGAADEERR